MVSPQKEWSKDHKKWGEVRYYAVQSWQQWPLCADFCSIKDVIAVKLFIPGLEDLEVPVDMILDQLRSNVLKVAAKNSIRVTKKEPQVRYNEVSSLLVRMLQAFTSKMLGIKQEEDKLYKELWQLMRRPGKHKWFQYCKFFKMAEEYHKYAN